MLHTTVLAQAFVSSTGPVASTLQGAGVLLGEAQVLLIQTLKRLVLSDLHTRAHVAVTMYKERERTGQVLAAGKETRGI